MNHGFLIVMMLKSCVRAADNGQSIRVNLNAVNANLIFIRESLRWRRFAGADARIQATHNRKDEAMEKKDFYSVKEVAKIFNVSTKTVLSSIKKGKIQASKFGNNNSHWRIPASEILPKE